MLLLKGGSLLPLSAETFASLLQASKLEDDYICTSFSSISTCETLIILSVLPATFSNTTVTILVNSVIVNSNKKRKTGITVQGLLVTSSP